MPDTITPIKKSTFCGCCKITRPYKT
ncbi:hypothetical protein [Intestinibacter sp.]